VSAPYALRAKDSSQGETVTRTVIAAALWLTFTHAVIGQSAVQHQSTTPPLDARFEIFQSAVDPTWTLRLDRVTGTVDQLVSGKSGTWVWIRMRVLPHPKAVNMMKPHYEIFASGSPSQAILLLDTESGATWQLNSKQNVSVWQPIE
jgi:hypothetical protein